MDKMYQTQLYLILYNYFLLIMSEFFFQRCLSSQNQRSQMSQDISPSNQQWEVANSQLEKNLLEDEDFIIQNLQNFNFEQQTNNDTPIVLAPDHQPTTTNKNSYEKNICGYISKKVVQSFLDPKYKSSVQKLCRKCRIQPKLVFSYYEQKNQEVFGIYHLTKMLTPKNVDDQEECGIKKVFSKFMLWFLRTKYIKYLLIFGKMAEKDIYVEFKNKYLLYIGDEVRINSSQL